MKLENKISFIISESDIHLQDIINLSEQQIDKIYNKLFEIGAGYAIGGSGYSSSQVGTSFGRNFSATQGGPNIMYTYDVKSLNHTLEPKVNSIITDENIQVGSTINGYIVNTKTKLEGMVKSIKYDNKNNILYYNVNDPKTNKIYKVEPTSAILVKYEASRLAPITINGDMMDAQTSESFEKVYDKILNEKMRSKSSDEKQPTLETSKSIPKEMKEKIKALGGGTYKLRKKGGGAVYGIRKPKIKGKEWKGVGFGADKDGFFVYTHRARSKSYETPEKIPQSAINFIESTG